VSRLPRNGRGFGIRGCRRHESRRQRRIWQLNQFLRRRLLSASRRTAQSAYNWCRPKTPASCETLLCDTDRTVIDANHATPL
jgi:hypothetical protein